MNCPQCRSLTIFEQIYQSKTPEEFAELFIEQNAFGLWCCVIFPGAWCDKQNAVTAVLEYFKRKLGVENES